MHYLVVGAPVSDIGKGRLTACLASTLGSEYLPIKIDPFLNRVVPTESEEDELASLSTDLQTYEKLGLTVSREQCIVSGNIVYDFLYEKSTNQKEHLGRRLTQTDLGEYLAHHLSILLESKGKIHSVIEVGGSLADSQMPYIAYGIRALAQSDLRPILLSYVEYGEDEDYPHKIHHVLEGITRMRAMYGEPFHVYFRNRKGAIELSDEQCIAFREAVARKALYPIEKITFLPEFEKLEEQREFVRICMRVY